jgi:hypothetical protein
MLCGYDTPDSLYRYRVGDSENSAWAGAVVMQGANGLIAGFRALIGPVNRHSYIVHDLHKTVSRSLRHGVWINKAKLTADRTERTVNLHRLITSEQQPGQDESGDTYSQLR